jgi:cytochrome c biogenesis protein
VVESKKAGTAVNYWLPALEGFAENDRSPFQFEPVDLKMGYFTGLEVSHEPGQWAVWSGVVLMGIGLALVFYVAHARVWAVPVRTAKGQLELWVGGTANRNRDAFEETFRELTAKIETRLVSCGEQQPTAEIVTLAAK